MHMHALITFNEQWERWVHHACLIYTHTMYGVFMYAYAHGAHPHSCTHILTHQHSHTTCLCVIEATTLEVWNTTLTRPTKGLLAAATESLFLMPPGPLWANISSIYNMRIIRTPDGLEGQVYARLYPRNNKNPCQDHEHITDHSHGVPIHNVTCMQVMMTDLGQDGVECHDGAWCQVCNTLSQCEGGSSLMFRLS